MGAGIERLKAPFYTSMTPPPTPLLIRAVISATSVLTMLTLAGSLPPASAQAAAAEAVPKPGGYCRFPAIHGDQVIFTAEGDLWEVGIRGGAAHRLTSHPGEESHAAVSPDGKLLAFSAQYEGPREVYVMPVQGGPPRRLTFEGGIAFVVGWTPDGKVLYSTRHFSTLPDWQLATADLKTGVTSPLPLSQASDGVFDPTGKTLYFTRQHFQGSSTKRYRGGTAQNLWKFALDGTEAVRLDPDYDGTSKSPMWWQNRIYFLSDRDGTMNLWSMDSSGHSLRQHTTHRGWDIKTASLSGGRVAYQIGADLRVLDLADGRDSVVAFTLASDFDQQREKWVKKPIEYLTAAHLSPDGTRLALTARGQVFVAPVGQGRFLRATCNQTVRFREAQFLPDNKSLLALSDQTGELEFARLPANGVGEPEILTHDGKIFRMDATPSLDGKWIAYQDKNLELWLLDLDTKKTRRVAASGTEPFSGLRWSPDSQWLAYVAAATNLYTRIQLYRVKDGFTTALTSDRVNSFSPAWSPNGKWLYFLSERHLESAVHSPWGAREPEPFFNDTVKVYLVSLTKEGRSPFEPNDELHPEEEKAAAGAGATGTQRARSATTPPRTGQTNRTPVVTIDLEGIQARVNPVPVPPGNYSDLALNDKFLYWIEKGLGAATKPRLKALAISNQDPKPRILAEDVKHYELSPDGKKILLRKEDDLYVVDTAAELKLDKSVDLKGWTFPLNPRDERRQMFIESWRLMRDYFYDPNMHGVDWPAIRDKYLPLVDRVTDRAELSDLMEDMVGELSALHTFVTGGDFREGPDQIKPGSLGARLSRDEAHGGYRIEHIYRSDPDYPERASPLAKPGLGIAEGDLISAINGVPALSAADPAVLLRGQAGRQVLLTLKPSATATPHDVIVNPLTTEQEFELHYDDWEYSRRLEVEHAGKGNLGYVHLRAMGAPDIAAWAREFYPVFDRQGLIVDVRHNRGGNIDSWVLEKLLRKAWFFWQPRRGAPTWNMPYAFRGHVVVLCDAHTASDGEAFSEGFRRLGLGKVIGTRTWGGEIWLSLDNRLVDYGIASAAETGVYGPEGQWLIEGHGVEPDLPVDNLPHATFLGQDAQLEAAIHYLQEQIRLEPIITPAAPQYPNKAFR